MEVVQENDQKQSDIVELTPENIPKLNLEESSFQLITKEPDKKDNKEDQSFNASEKSDNNIQKSKIEKSTEDNSVINLSKKNSVRINTTESKERKNTITLNIEEIKEEKYNDKKNKKKKKVNLNSLPPEVYLGENIVRTKFNINPMEIK